MMCLARTASQQRICPSSRFLMTRLNNAITLTNNNGGVFFYFFCSPEKMCLQTLLDSHSSARSWPRRNNENKSEERKHIIHC